MTKETLDEKVWIVDCGICAAKELATWKEACEEGCPVCGSHSISIYHEKNKEK